MKTRGVLGDRFSAILKETAENGTFKKEKIIMSAQGSHVQLKEKGEVLNFCSNNYLGLSNAPAVVEKAKQVLDSHGFGLSSVRFICGTQDLHKELEKKLAELYGMEDCVLFPSAFDANAGIFEALLTPNDAIFSDALNHASIIDGVRLSKCAKKIKYNHLDMTDLEEKLAAAVADVNEDSPSVQWVVSDSVFSMDGDMVRLDKLVRICSKFPNTYLMLDECHSTGVVGPSGVQGVFAAKADVVTGTLGKALGGGTGGYVCGPKDMMEMLRQRARPYLFSNSIVPSVVGGSIKALDLVREDPAIFARLKKNTEYFRMNMYDAGFTLLGNDECPIVPVLLGDAKTASLMAQELMDRGIYVVAFSYPVVPKGGARIRVQISAAHTKEELQKAVSAFISVGKELGIIGLHKGEAAEQRKEKK